MLVKSLLTFCLFAFVLVFAQSEDDAIAMEVNRRYTLTIDAKEPMKPHYLDVSKLKNIREIRVTMREYESSTLDFDPDLYVNFEAPADKDNYRYFDNTVQDFHEVVIPTQDIANLNRVYIGVINTASQGGRITLRIRASSCRNRNCGEHDDPTKTAGTCDKETGTCTCIPGFLDEFCAIETRTDLKANDNEASYYLDIGRTVYYKIDAVAPRKYGFMNALITRDDDSRAAFDAFFKFGGVPAGDHTDDVYNSSFYDQKSLTVSVDSKDYRPGMWYLGIRADSKSALKIKVKLNYYGCKNNCSGNGTCNHETSVCRCRRGYIRDDCSINSEILDAKKPQRISLAQGDTVTFTAEVSAYQASAPTELGFQLEAIAGDTGSSNYPLMYVRYDKAPTTLDYDIKSSIPTSFNQTVYVPRSLKKAGNYHVMVYNPNSSQANYYLRMKYRAHCPVGCEDGGRGRCNEVGTCICAQGFIGNDCSVIKSDCVTLANASRGMEVPVSIFLIVLGFVVGMAGGIFVFKKWFFVAPQTTPELNYDQLST